MQKRKLKLQEGMRMRLCFPSCDVDSGQNHQPALLPRLFALLVRRYTWKRPDLGASEVVHLLHDKKLMHWRSSKITVYSHSYKYENSAPTAKLNTFCFAL
ncbi:hypothetical protein ElyMa_001660000 [Elysia marginata]|uniref:Uncharacterized protein n=1 Tax=Elysia marginata TaxID=1093978 RepID=A0AAV4JSE4_9GAST|nr:hypothetical protein ElyMa_001660000 [Elysia marginata]